MTTSGDFPEWNKNFMRLSLKRLTQFNKKIYFRFWKSFNSSCFTVENTIFGVSPQKKNPNRLKYSRHFMNEQNFKTWKSWLSENERVVCCMVIMVMEIGYYSRHLIFSPYQWRAQQQLTEKRRNEFLSFTAFCLFGREVGSWEVLWW